RRRDYYYRKAKQLDYRSRASFKLIQINDRFNLFKHGMTVVDLGAAPGGWLQVAAERVGPKGKVVGVDLQPIEPIDGVQTIKGDIRKQEVMDELLVLTGGKVDLVLSDMSPNITGSYSMDHARSIELCEMALTFALATLSPNGKMVFKMFEGDLSRDLVAEVQKHFETVKRYSPEASRSSSSEIYVVAKGFGKGPKVQSG
ncbi:MAG TPA: RlmE family RNA methyltransferase, partial [Methanomassiliicoccales archaeon]|nr:RlmE family RNA methyltransferase [Methanomassiliicoccales archaeon]